MSHIASGDAGEVASPDNATAAEDERLIQFLSLTGTDDIAVAQHLLDLAGGDLSKAVGLFLGDNEAPPTSSPSPPSQSHQRPSASPMIDPQVAAALGADDGWESPDGSVRAALPAFAETLLGGPDFLPRQYTASSAPSVNTMVRGGDPLSEGDRAFTDLFSPPVEIGNEALSFEQCLTLARKENRYLLVNIQKDNTFDSLRLNRDVWKAEAVVEVLHSSFVFWQRNALHRQGAEFCGLYKVTKFPFVGALDGRTGRLLKSWNSNKLQDEFSAASEFIEFIEAQEVKAKKRAAAAAAGTHSSSGSSSSTSAGPNSAAVDIATIEYDTVDISDDDGEEVNVDDSSDGNDDEVWEDSAGGKRGLPPRSTLSKAAARPSFSVASSALSPKRQRQPAASGSSTTPLAAASSSSARPDNRQEKANKRTSPVDAATPTPRGAISSNSDTSNSIDATLTPAPSTEYADVNSVLKRLAAERRVRQQQASSS